jgi:hypothetical protein
MKLNPKYIPLVIEMTFLRVISVSSTSIVREGLDSVGNEANPACADSRNAFPPHLIGGDGGS